MAASATKKTRQEEQECVEDWLPDEEDPELVSTPSNALVVHSGAPKPKRQREAVVAKDGELRSPTEAAIIDTANIILHRSGNGSSQIFDRRFRSHFGVSPFVAGRCWDLLQQEQDGQQLTGLHTMERHLWSLMLLMGHGTEETSCTKASGVDKQTFRTWAWDFVDRICDLESVVVSWTSFLLLLSFLANLLLCCHLQIVWENRKRRDEGNDCLTSVDGVNFRCPNSTKLFCSHKFKKGGLRHLIVLCIKTGDIICIEGPFPCGLHNDVKCLRWSLLNWLDENERMEADDGFIGECPKHCKCPGSFVADETKLWMQNRVRSRHETVNKRMKQFQCLRANPFRHSIDKHSKCVRAVAVLTQLAIEEGEPLFEVDCSDN